MVMRKVSWIAMLGIFGPVGLGVANAQNVATVSVNVSSPGKVIPTDFDGFSIEVGDSANKYLGVASSPNLVFYQLLQNLGKATIRGTPARRPSRQGAHSPSPRMG